MAYADTPLEWVAFCNTIQTDQDREFTQTSEILEIIEYEVILRIVSGPGSTIGTAEGCPISIYHYGLISTTYTEGQIPKVRMSLNLQTYV